jgi:phage tail tape-measure protein
VSGVARQLIPAGLYSKVHEWNSASEVGQEAKAYGRRMRTSYDHCHRALQNLESGALDVSMQQDQGGITGNINPGPGDSGQTSD